MYCPKCGFAMSDLDTECARCKRQGPPAQAKAPETPAAPPAKAGPPPAMSQAGPPIPIAPAAPAAPPPRKSQFPFDSVTSKADTNNSGTREEPPAEVGELGWCWGAFGVPWIWGIGNRVWIALVVFVPYIGPFFAFYLGAVGHRLAWQNRRFESFDQYRDTMRTWNTWAWASLGSPQRSSS